MPNWNVVLFNIAFELAFPGAIFNGLKHRSRQGNSKPVFEITRSN